ncbi:hypothetical protein [Nostoc sp.]|uniref:hypothetical protein n=1 Tax=Nostoc sp. TaxID=1180 RepID=UPI002FF46EE1
MVYESFHLLLSCSEEVKTAADVKTWKDAIVLGYDFQEKNQCNEAITAYMKAIEIEPSLSLSYFELNYIICYCTLLEQNELARIIASYHQIIQGRLTPSYADVALGDIVI